MNNVLGALAPVRRGTDSVSNIDGNQSLATDPKPDIVTVVAGLIRVAEAYQRMRLPAPKETHESSFLSLSRSREESPGVVRNAANQGEELVVAVAWSSAVIAVCYRVFLDPRQRLTLRGWIQSFAKFCSRLASTIGTVLKTPHS